MITGMKFQSRLGFNKKTGLLSFGFSSASGSPIIEKKVNTLTLATNLKTYLLFLSEELDYTKEQEVGLGMNFKT